MSEATKASYLTDTNISNLQTGQSLVYNGTDWVNETKIFASVHLPTLIIRAADTPVILDNWVSNVASGITVADGFNHLFKATQSGWYSLGFCIGYGGTTEDNATDTILEVVVRGVTFHTLQNYHLSDAANVKRGSFGGSFLIQLTSGDEIQFKVNIDGNVEHDINGFASLVKVD
jgi:hypothetical protein